MEDDFKLSNQAIHAIVQTALTAGDSILDIYSKSQSHLLMKIKDDDSPLTIADKTSNNIIISRLAEIAPGMSLLSEEESRFFTPSSQYWLIDPLDGTKEFISNRKEYTVNIALIKNAKPEFGVIYAPALGKLYWGGPEQGAYYLNTLNQKKRNLPRVSNLTESCQNQLKVITSFSHLDVATKDYMASLGDVDVTSIGSSLKFCYVAENKFDLYPRLAPIHSWDIAAGHAILLGSSGILVDHNWNPITYEDPLSKVLGFVALSAKYKNCHRVHKR